MKQQPIDIMVDIETTGVHHNSGILSIGACVINGFDHQLNFYEKSDWQQLEKDGFIIDPSTMDWWNKPHNVLARAEAFSGKIRLADVLYQFNDWLNTVASRGFLLWSKPASFDCSLIKDAMDHYGIVPAWTHQEERCFRTLEKTFHWVKKPAFIGTAHNALADAKNQAAHLAAILNWIETQRLELFLHE